MKGIKSVKAIMVTCFIALLFSATVFAASESLNGGGATWSGGENSDGILYSKVVDNKEDGLRYSVTVWVQDDKGNKSEESGTTDAVGEKGKVEVTRAATHSNPFVTEKSGYKN